MRTGGCTVQQALSPEAASVVKQAMTLARRRGHAQVTPLHVANTMLVASPTGLFRKACLQYSHSHPLQCKALELCFNVALNRLPTSSTTSSSTMPIFGGCGGVSAFPSIANALVAAFKRAQAHQRRGTVDNNQQQPILTVKIELDQLVISILDDPSVSRVMREAGFSSTQVKNNVEQAVSMEICSKTNPNNTKPKEPITSPLSLSPHPQFQTKPQPKPFRTDDVDDDVMYVVDNLVNNKKRRNFVIVGESLTAVERVMRGVIDKFDRRDVPEALRDVKFVTLSLSSLGNQMISRAEVEQRIEELRNLVRSCVNRGVVLNLGDLEWVVEYRERMVSRVYRSYCAVEHMVMEIGKLACGEICENGAFWLMGLATFQTHIRCKSGYPPLESVWSLNPLTIPTGSLRLSLVTNSVQESEQLSDKKVGTNGSRWLQLEDGAEKQLTCCPDCTAKFDAEARNLRGGASALPAWLQQYKNENDNNDQDIAVTIKDIRKKWNSICNAVHKQPYSSLSPSSSSSFSNPNFHNHHQISFIPEPFSSNTSSTRNSPTSSDPMDITDYYTPNLKTLTSQNLTLIRDALEKKVPWQKDIIPEIASTILKRRSRESENGIRKRETWMFFEGADFEGKEKIARELANLIFNSQNKFLSISLSSFTISEDSRNKRSRDENSWSYIERFSDAATCDPHRVFFIEDIDQADYHSQMGFKRAVEKGQIKNAETGEEVSIEDAIVIFSCERFSSRSSRACSQKSSSENSERQETGVCVSLDLNLSIEDEVSDDTTISDIGLLEAVDGRFNFEISNVV